MLSTTESPFYDPDRLHRRLALSHSVRLTPGLPSSGWKDDLVEEVTERYLEGEFVERERAAIQPTASHAPTNANEFVQWFESLKESGPGQNDPLFEYLAEEATLEEMRWFLTQEVAGEAGFDDLVAMTQVKLPARPKLEMARNYFDEMGRGNALGMHGPMLERLQVGLGLPKDSEGIVWESLALGNLLVALATTRRYAYHALGALGVIELTAPGRSEKVNAGLKRLGVAAQLRHYFALHSTLDVKHSRAWNDEIFRPLAEQNSVCAQAMAEGALMRLRAGARCFDRYRREFNF